MNLKMEIFRNKIILNNKYLITGGTGSFGQACRIFSKNQTKKNNNLFKVNETIFNTKNLNQIN